MNRPHAELAVSDTAEIAAPLPPLRRGVPLGGGAPFGGRAPLEAPLGEGAPLARGLPLGEGAALAGGLQLRGEVLRAPARARTRAWMRSRRARTGVEHAA